MLAAAQLVGVAQGARSTSRRRTRSSGTSSACRSVRSRRSSTCSPTCTCASSSHAARRTRRRRSSTTTAPATSTDGREHREAPRRRGRDRATARPRCRSSAAWASRGRCSPHYFLKRAWVLEQAFGTGDEHALALSDALAADVEQRRRRGPDLQRRRRAVPRRAAGVARGRGAAPRHAAATRRLARAPRVRHRMAAQALRRRLRRAALAGGVGGRGLPVSQQLVYLEEYAAPNAPYISVNFVGMMHAGPTLIAEGTDEQRAFHLPRILRGESVWCQGFSEPEAGSDLASLRTRAERHGDEYVVNGQKIWSTRAHVADYCELLVRTDPDAPKHKGITLADPRHAPARRRSAADADDRRREPLLRGVPRRRARAGRRTASATENDGWRVTNVTLRFERGTAFAQHIITLRSQIRALVVLALAPPDDAGPVGRRRAARPRRPAAGERRRAVAHDADGHRRGRAHGHAGADGLGGEAALQRARARRSPT